MSRSLAREDAFKLIFEMEITKISAADAIQYLYDTVNDSNEMWAQKNISQSNKQYIENVVLGIEENKAEINEKIQPLLKNWSLGRISKVNLAILQLAFYEIEYINDIPYKVSANEAVNIAKKYGGNESGSFVNGVIGNILKTKDIEGN